MGKTLVLTLVKSGEVSLHRTVHVSQRAKFYLIPSFTAEDTHSPAKHREDEYTGPLISGHVTIHTSSLG